MAFKTEITNQLETFTDKNFIIPVILVDITLIPFLISNNFSSSIKDSLLVVIAINLVLVLCYLFLWIFSKYVLSSLFIKFLSLLKIINQKVNPYYRIKKLEEKVNEHNIDQKKELIIPNKEIIPSKIKKEILNLDQNIINLLKYLIEERFIFMWDINKKYNISFVEFYNIFQDLSKKGILVSESKPLHKSSLIKLNPYLLEHEEIITWLINDDYKK